jgi:hypothetical protein
MKTLLIVAVLAALVGLAVPAPAQQQGTPAWCPQPIVVPAPAQQDAPVTYKDACGTWHTTTSKAQIDCERDRGGHYSIGGGGVCIGGRPGMTPEEIKKAVAESMRSAGEADTAADFSRAVAECARESGVTAYPEANGHIQMLGTAEDRFNFQRCMKEHPGSPVKPTR